MLSKLPFTINALHDAYAAGASPVDVIDEIFARLEAVNDPGIFIHLCARESLRAEAAVLGKYDPDKPLWGIPYAVKDNIDVSGIETTAACPAYAYMPDEDAFLIAKLRAAGALMIGKTNLDQFATGLVGVRTPYGAPLNAIDPEIVPGGSSGGSGVVVGHGIVSFALGTDTAGSGRVPAALNNIVGLKPTLGALSASGVVPACRTTETVSIFALTVDDAYAAFAIARGFDAADAYSKPMTHEPLSAPQMPLRVGIPDPASIKFFGDTVQKATFERDIADLAARGAIIEPIDFEPLYAIAEMLYQGAWVAERYTVIADLLAKDPEAIHPVTRKIITHAESMSAADAFNGFYRLAELKRAAEPMLARLDLLCVPTIPTFYTVADLDADPVTPNSNNGTYTNFVNLLDMCGVAVPTAPRSDGRPGSVTLLAGAGKDALVAAVARDFEKDCPRMMGATRHPAPSPTPLPLAVPDTIELAVCGAHMSDLPLNWQLTDLGGVFVRKARTTSDYKFYALAGGPPARPGLVKTGDAGAAIALEIWSLPKTAFGTFMAGIPAPLGIGTVSLSDGSSVKGFLCEASGLDGATDITALGDWRSFLAQDAVPA
ncbi:allophanate hydrolase [Yoonia sediminilitoris]|uniref:Allophanate hydrolase n=1 Tax=Yoonia sediminilitoris TaxID=1286148 RepID=A0A2T6KM71_9RHOB|nr:allophanate hydrolase [Yoonia sediminilitoris]PUB17316.1 allophanate hydrolase [Yoonia sediminilitoris]RCW97611.1 allophanate hydrolase [Yoonia sediminilitoris]